MDKDLNVNEENIVHPTNAYTLLKHWFTITQDMNKKSGLATTNKLLKSKVQRTGLPTENDIEGILLFLSLSTAKRGR